MAERTPIESMPAFARNDGGRIDAGYRGRARDCVTRAISIAADLPYQYVYDLINGEALKERPGKRRSRSSARNGVSKATTRRVMVKLGWEWHPTMKIGSGCLVHPVADELPAGRLVVSVSKHLVAVSDGVVHDTSDPRRDGTRCVYGYWTAAQ